MTRCLSFVLRMLGNGRCILADDRSQTAGVHLIDVGGRRFQTYSSCGGNERDKMRIPTIALIIGVYAGTSALAQTPSVWCLGAA